MVLRNVVQILGPAERATPAGLILLGVVNLHRRESLRVVVRKRFHQDVVHYAEDRRRCANSQRQRNDGDQREAAALPKRASGVPDILSKRVHVDPPATRKRGCKSRFREPGNQRYCRMRMPASERTELHRALKYGAADGKVPAFSDSCRGSSRPVRANPYASSIDGAANTSSLGQSA